ncbi:MAG: D-2-hydroxyacid dehydrogenase [Sporolactobacillus sp.]
MRILIYGASPDEQPYIQQWSAAHSIETVSVKEPLSEATVGLASGADGISIQQTVSIGGLAVYEKLHALGIRQISTRTAGYDMVDLEAAQQNQLIVTNVPAYSPYAVAELAVAQTMQLTRHLATFHRRFVARNFTWRPLIAKELRELTIGIIGTGRIGATAAELFKGLGATLIGFDVYRNPQLGGVLDYRATLEQVLQEADVVSLHTPLMAATRHMIHADNLKLMKKTAYLINVARGGLIDTEALIAALKKGQIAGAALDAFEDESFINHDLSEAAFHSPQVEQLSALGNVLLTPHIGFYTETAIKNMVMIGLSCVADIIHTGTSANSIKGL